MITDSTLENYNIQAHDNIYTCLDVMIFECVGCYYFHDVNVIIFKGPDVIIFKYT